MKIQLVRNATLILEYSGRRLLIDPMLCAKHSFRSFAGKSENPTVDLPDSLPIKAILDQIDGVLVSHLHPDHFDEVAQQALDKGLPILTQPESQAAIAEMGFENVIAVADSVAWAGIEITATPGEHGYGAWVERMGPVSGFVFRAPSEPTLFWVGDSVLIPAVETALSEAEPDVVVTHSGGAMFDGPETMILMDAQQTIDVAQSLPKATVVAVHLEALDHCTVSRTGLQAAAEQAGIADRLIIPADGEIVNF